MAGRIKALVSRGMDKLRIAVITQNDLFAIPRNFDLLCSSDFVEVTELTVINSVGSLENKRVLFVRGFGLLQSAKMGVATFWYLLRDFIACRLRFLGMTSWLNLKGLCQIYGVRYYEEGDVNASVFLDRLQSSDLDVVVSFSAPTVFKERLLTLPKFGCINLHCSALPSYAGVLPSFWTLLNDEKKVGVSVHLMDSKIDNGAVLAQAEVDISSMDSMFDVIRTTKLRGGSVMLGVLDYIQTNRRLPNPVDTTGNKHSYFGWPKVADMKRFVAQGKKLI